MIKSIMSGWVYNCTRKAPWLGRGALHCIPDWRVQLQLDEIGPFCVQLRKHRSFWLRNPLASETFCANALQRFINPGDVVYDVGSNIGLFVRWMAGLGAGQVIGFEPVPENVKLLDRNIALGAISDRVRIFTLALGETNGLQRFQLDDLSSASGCLDSVSGGLPSEVRRHYGLQQRSTEVKVAVLDDLIRDSNLPVPAVVKIDVEGAEGAVLRGAESLLTAHALKLVVELHGIDKACEVVEILTSKGYYCFGYARLDGASSYRQIERRDLDRMTDRFDLHYLIAAKDLAEVREPVLRECVAA